MIPVKPKIHNQTVLKILELTRSVWFETKIPLNLSMSIHNHPKLTFFPNHNLFPELVSTKFHKMDKNNENRIFYITLKKTSNTPSFANLKIHKESDFSLPILYPSQLGEFLLEEIKRIHDSDKSIDVLHHYIMPEKIHIILSIKNDKLDFLITNIKFLMDRLHHAAVIERLIHISDKLFQDSFDFKHIPSEFIYNKTIKYIRTKPIVHTIVNEDPDIFTKINWINIEGTICQLFGAVTFLFNPFKYHVSIPKNISTWEKDALIKDWLHAADNGGVLVGSFITAEEKEFLEELWETSARIILINQTPLKENQIPSKHFLKRCRDRNLLIMIPYPPEHISNSEISIEQYHMYRKYLDDFAKTVIGL